jgi:transglutaminase-like putative cysteine protease
MTYRANDYGIQWRRAAMLTIALLSCATVSHAQFLEEDDSVGVQYGEYVVQRWKAGVEFTAGRAGCRGVIATVPIPANWPEQRVRLVEEDTSSGTRLTYRNLPPGVRQMMVANPSVPSGQSFHSLITVEVARAEQIPPEDTTPFVIPTSRTLPSQARSFLRPSPFIESTHSRMRTIYNETTSEYESAWDKVSAIYDYVRDNVEYKDEQQSVKGAVAALNDGYGDCEDMTSLFIAICRAGDVPARTVWVDGHCYPEFLLLDDEENPHWFPCQVAGSYAFGGMPDLRIILQKGDLFRTPEEPDLRKRYAAEFLRTSGAPPARYRFVRERLTE